MRSAATARSGFTGFTHCTGPVEAAISKKGHTLTNFPITVAKGVDRGKLTKHLEAAQIETRLVFGGNILRQPGYIDIEKRVSGSLENSDRIMQDTFFIGVFPGLTEEMLTYVLSVFEDYFKKN